MAVSLKVACHFKTQSSDEEKGTIRQDHELADGRLALVRQKQLRRLQLS